MSLFMMGFSLVLFTGCTGNTHDTGDTDTGDTGTGAFTTDVALRDAMRQLWTEHVVWTRMFLVDTIAGLPSTPQSTERLLANQADIGDAIRPFYGDAAGDALTVLLEEHILGAAAVLEAAMAGDTVAFEAANDAWHTNADAIAAFLAGANPAWDEAMLSAHMAEHLDLTLQEATARLTGDWEADIEVYDQIQDQIIGLADDLAAGIATQFPEEVSVSDIPLEDQELHLGMRALWEDHVVWTRMYLVADIAGLPDTPQATGRLLQNQADIGEAVVPYFGAQAGADLTGLLEEHILGAAAIVDAAQAGDAQAQATATDAWFDNAHEIAAFLANANPAWPEGDLVTMMDMHLDLTLDEATARLTQDWDADVVAFDAVEVEILEMADGLTDGLVAYRDANPW